jgi:hypothetical protein
MTLGNQLGDTCVYEPEVVDRLNKRSVATGGAVEAELLTDWQSQIPASASGTERASTGLLDGFIM